MIEGSVDNPARTPVLLACPFRPFFLLAALYAALLVAVWVVLLFGGLSLALAMDPAQWHSHEMLFGMVAAAITGFLLTAISNWTASPPLRGGGLLALVLLWLAGRAVMWSSAYLPPWLTAAVDLAFLPAVALYAARVLVRNDNRKNLVLVAMLSMLALANLAMHLGFAGAGASYSRLGEIIAMDLVAVIMIVIGGRITPAFTANWLRLKGRDPAIVRRSDRLDAFAMASVLLMVPADLATGAPWLGALAALAAAVINGWRLLRWRGWSAAGEPLLWILHVGLAWVVVALALKAAAPLLGIAPSAWMHALGAGAMGTLILGVMTRVAMGHTGRALRLPPGGVAIYAAITIAALARLAAALDLADFTALIIVSALGWVIAFALFLVLYWTVLSSPRVDGRPG